VGLTALATAQPRAASARRGRAPSPKPGNRRQHHSAGGHPETMVILGFVIAIVIVFTL
jgi:hypothetical protein